jgi:hypothetical protein
MTTAASTEYFSYFRPAEVTLILRPPRSGHSHERLLAADQTDAARGLFGDLGVALHADPYSAERDGSGPRRRLPAHLQRAGGDVVLHTVNLEGWYEDVTGRHIGLDPLSRSVRDVGHAVRRINRRAAGGALRLGDYEVVAASPNWSAVPLNGW